MATQWKTLEHFSLACGNVRWHRGFGTQFESSSKVYTELSCGPATPLSNRLPRKLKTYVHTKACAWRFHSSISKSQNNSNFHQPKSRETKQGIYLEYDWEYYSAIKVNEVLTRTITCMDLETIRRREREGSRKGRLVQACVYVNCLQYAKPCKREVAGGWRNRGRQCLGTGIGFLWGRWRKCSAINMMIV